MFENKDQPTIATLTKNLTPLLPEKIGPYKVDSLFKKGGMSILYLAIHPETKRPVILKVLSPKYIQSKEMVDRFIKEAEIIKLFNHPNIIKLYSEGTWEGGFYIAMEFIQGVSLKQFLLEKSFTSQKALEIILQVSYAICHLHSHGIIHRDLKPENIIITDTGQIKVIDFGIAQILKKEEERITIKKRIMGTPSYMSPEQKEDPKNVSYSSDIFSLGVITYELILGKLSHGILHLMLIPKKLRAILEKALKIDPKERYQDIVDFITDISEYLKYHDIKEEKEDEEKFDEIYSSLKSIEDLLIPKKFDSWKNIEIAIAKETQLALNDTYVDFFKLKDNIFAIAIIKTEKKDLKSFMHLAIFRGYLKMAIDSFSKKNEFRPSVILNELNQIICKDNLNEKFIVNFVVLKADTDELFYAFSEENSGFSINTSTMKVSSFEKTDNILGKDPNKSYNDSTILFKISNRLVLTSNPIDPTKKELFEKHLLDSSVFSSSEQLDKIVSAFNNFSSKKDKLNVIICLQRLH